ncbi:unnamed protein product [Paramecium octaurelia]|uniref:Uncharacterized protein n=1 Tax=Paramecium octaurelia TaxID=43137 RepID=A0A8S1UWC0_PAROT|nr:unnamed protein product [Paramecium octaurelia]
MTILQMKTPFMLPLNENRQLLNIIIFFFSSGLSQSVLGWKQFTSNTDQNLR